MEETSDVTLVGLGKQGGRWLRAFDEEGFNVAEVVDPDPRNPQLAEEYGVDIVSPEEAEFDTPFCCIAVPVPHHEEYLRKAIESNAVETVIVEKPSTEHPRQSFKLAEKAEEEDTDVFVNYIERQHGAYRPVAKAISSYDIHEMFHWRGKEPRNIHAYTRDDVCHDLSELLAIFGTEKIRELDIAEVTRFSTWADKTGRFVEYKEREMFDVHSTTYLDHPDGKEVTLTGGFDESIERRYFLWTDIEEEVAFLVCTLDNEHVEPIALKIEGRENISYARRRAYHGDIVDAEDFERIAERTRAQVFAQTQENPYNLMVRDIANGGTRWTTSLYEAAQLESVIEEIYKIAMGRVPPWK